MPKALALLWCWSLLAADVGQLQQLADKNRFFELRRDLQQPGWNASETLFYRAVLECRFGQEEAGIELLRRVLATNPSRIVARKADAEMASAFERLGRYKDAAQAWTEALSLTPRDEPGREGKENSRALMSELGDVAPETAEFAGDAPVVARRNRLGSWNVPVRVNGAAGEWIFDTGANVSTLTETEAKRMGLSVRRTKAYVAGSTQKRNELQLAVASDVQLGAAHIHNVVFLVLADRALHIGRVHYQITGILGLPALRALRRVEISKGGMVSIGRREAVAGETPNLCFDEASPIVEVEHEQHQLQMFLDTGANATVLYPSFLDALGRDEKSGLRTKREKVGGAGGVIQRTTKVVPALEIEVLGKRIRVSHVSLLSEAPPGNDRYREGVVGMDALWGGFKLDFDAMRVEVE